MKNQYFGDVHDLFKYDLIIQLISNSNLTKFTFIPMLTPNEDTKEGNKTKYTKNRVGHGRTDLRRFLERCVREQRRHVLELYKYFDQHPLRNRSGEQVKIYIHHDEKNPYFTHENRATYFKEIPPAWLNDAVILVDPDVGIVVKSATIKTLHKYVTHDEIRHLSERMNANSILVIFQYIPRVNRDQYYQNRLNEIHDSLKNENCQLQFISDNQVVFFVITKNLEVFKQSARILHRYAESYPLQHGTRTIQTDQAR